MFKGAYIRKAISVSDLGSLYLGGLYSGGAYIRDFMVSTIVLLSSLSNYVSRKLLSCVIQTQISHHISI